MRTLINSQPHLGRPEDNYKPEDNVGSFLAVAKILKVHHKNNTADIQLLLTRDLHLSDETEQGKYGARISIDHAHFDTVFRSSSGVIQPMQPGQLVIVAFLENNRRHPVILGSLHNTYFENHNMLPEEYPIVERREELKYLNVHPTQFYTRIDGVGGIEQSHPSKTFLKVDYDPHSEISDTHKGFDHDDLKEKDPIKGGTRCAVEDEPGFPVKILFVHRSNYEDADTTWTKFFMDADGMFRVSRDNNDSKLTYIETSPEGRYLIRRQLDSPVHDSGSNYVQTEITVDGACRMTRRIGNKETTIEVTNTGKARMVAQDGSYVQLDNGNIDLRATHNISITAGGHIYISEDD